MHFKEFIAISVRFCSNPSHLVYHRKRVTALPVSTAAKASWLHNNLQNLQTEWLGSNQTRCLTFTGDTHDSKRLQYMTAAAFCQVQNN